MRPLARGTLPHESHTGLPMRAPNNGATAKVPEPPTPVSSCNNRNGLASFRSSAASLRNLANILARQFPASHLFAPLVAAAERCIGQPHDASLVPGEQTSGRRKHPPMVEPIEISPR